MKSRMAHEESERIRNAELGIDAHPENRPPDMRCRYDKNQICDGTNHFHFCEDCRKDMNRAKEEMNRVRKEMNRVRKEMKK